MKPKLAIVFCIHHKPWLLMSTLITIALQDYCDFDCFFIKIKGNGESVDKEEYKEYYLLAEKYGINPQLSPWDEQVIDVANGFTKSGKYYIEVENDHALDSGAWYKFLKSGLWKSYDHCLFLQEGTLLTSPSVLSSLVNISKSSDIDFVSAGHEKRRIPKNIFENYSKNSKRATLLDNFHDEKIRETFEIFSRDKEFKLLYSAYPNNFQLETQDHVPDKIDSFVTKLYQSLRSLKHENTFPLLDESIYVNTLRRKRSEIVGEMVNINGVNYHAENEIEWFGCSAQHFLSYRIIEKLVHKLDEHKIWDVLDLPYSGTALEIIWGMMPSWLGFNKYFFDGIHRVRKNFISYKREDDAYGMTKYINSYYKGMIEVSCLDEKIKINKYDKRYNYIRNKLSDMYFK